MSSLKFVVSSLDAIASSKDAQRNKQLATLANTALDAIKEQDKLPDPELVFAPLQLATKTNNTQLITSSLDCIGKLISYSYFSVPSKDPNAEPEPESQPEPSQQEQQQDPPAPEQDSTPKEEAEKDQESQKDSQEPTEKDADKDEAESDAEEAKKEGEDKEETTAQASDEEKEDDKSETKETKEETDEKQEQQPEPEPEKKDPEPKQPEPKQPEPQPKPQQPLPPPLIERAIDTICDCFQGETTAVEIQLQIVKSLLAAVLNDKIVVHGAGLLKAVRQVYNVFLLSRSTANQQVAQGTLTQMVGTVFERVKTRLHMKEERLNLANSAAGSHHNASSSEALDQSVHGHGAEDHDDIASQTANGGSINGDDDAAPNGAKLTLKDLEHRKSFDDSNLGDGPTTVTRIKTAGGRGRGGRDDSASVSGHSATTNATFGGPHDDAEALEAAEDEVYIRDAYLVFRSFCNLSTKVLPPDQLYEIRGQPMRSKLVSLHLIHTLLNNNISVFTSPLCTIRNSKSNESTSFLQAIKFYLCLSITRNGASSVDRVFEVCSEIFWLMLKFMRPSFKVRPLF